MIQHNFFQSSAKLNAGNIREAVDGLNQLIDAVTATSAPFRTKGIFRRQGCDIATVETDGKLYRVQGRFCYFNPRTAEPGEVVEYDSRYASEKKLTT